MANYSLVSDYKHNKVYRESFNKLAKLVFGIDFNKWYEKGYWNDDYICYSFVNKEQIIANAAINKMTIVLKDQEYKAIQVGTVMTHPNYRNLGLSRKLLNYIIEKYEEEYDFIYLFANDSVLDFYPKFGFNKVLESSFTLKTSSLKKHQANSDVIRRLDINAQEDFQKIKEFAKKRVPVSSTLSVKNNEHLLMFYIIQVFHDAIYYSEEDDIILLLKQDTNHLHIFDIISAKKVNLDKILNKIVSEHTEQVHFHFTPDYDCESLHIEYIMNHEDTLFVRPLLKNVPKHFLFPLTSHA
ncbi:GNAT family N-acetyltransferase [Rummeliibacillus sp. JY-2-4R]